MQNLAIRFWSILFISVGLAIIAHKVFQLGIPITPDTSTQTWTIQAQLALNGSGKNIKASFSVPNITPGFTKIDEHFISGDFVSFSDFLKKEWENQKSLRYV